jgi:hypothetical protein
MQHAFPLCISVHAQKVSEELPPFKATTGLSSSYQRNVFAAHATM